jgi:hypothetical protein
MSNVKVYLRIKPHLDEEAEHNPLPMEVHYQGGRKRLYFQYRLQQNDTKIFNFDNIFQEDSSQEEVYNEFGADLMNSVHNGVNLAHLVQLLPHGLWPNVVRQVLHSLGW